MKCTYCGQEITDQELPDSWSRSTVWLHGTKKDSAFDRQPTGENMHGTCMKKYRDGIPQDMESMF